ncbi:MAG: DUF1800 domain-containing protein [Thalassovita sp.]
MTFDPLLAEKRFGYGLSPLIAPPQSVSEMLGRLQAPDAIAEQFPIEPFAQFRNRMIASQTIWKERRKNRGSPRAQDLRKELNLLKKEAREQHRRWVSLTMLRRTWTADAFRERLAAFWADHFFAQGKAGILKRGTSPYIEEAIRPHLNGSFATLLTAVITSPLMVHYLDQENSMGPDSPKSIKRGSKGGLNENLARELLELHTLGVGAPYTQTDVRELANLLAGLTQTANQGGVFRKDFAQPGAETVLGRDYGGDKPHIRDIHAVLKDLAQHPATAQHLAQKLAVHFVSDTPPAELVEALAAAYRDSGGDLAVVNQTLLAHPAAWQPKLENLKLPDEYVASAMRALAVAPEVFTGIQSGRTHEKLAERLFLRPLARMGQPWQAPLGPDGWPEQDDNWLTPQGLSARMEWALLAPAALRDPLPDPRVFVHEALGPNVPEPILFAAKGAASRPEAIALILSSPAFQRK